jgi:hypothetical protein
VATASTGCPKVDLSWPSGCPSGFTAEEVFYTPNSEAAETFGSGNTPVPGNGGCPLFACVNAAGQSPIQVANAACQSGVQGNLPLVMMGAGVVGLVALPGWLKLLGLACIAGGLLQGIGTNRQAQMASDGSYAWTCVTAPTSW